MSTKLRWGIMGTGNIARQFAAGVNASRRGIIAAVGSRSASTARQFAAEYKAPAAHDSYDRLIADPDVDAVYVSLPNSMHHEWTIKSLRAGKHVLCEKPFAIDAGQSEEMFDVAERQGRVLVEAFMYRSHPLTRAVMRAFRDGAIGELKLIRTSFCYRTTKIEGNVRFSTELAGGVLMDVGCYCINFSRFFAGQEPSRVSVAAHLHETGVDDVVAGTILFPNGVVASFTCGMSVQADNTAYLCGTEGYIEVPIPWKPPVSGAEFVISHGNPPRMDKGKPGAPPPREVRKVDAGTDLYGLEADDFAATVLDGAAPALNRHDTVGNMCVLDQMRAQINP